MFVIAPKPASVVALFKDWTGRGPKVRRSVKSAFPRTNLPEVLYPSGGLCRIWYDSDKMIPEEGRFPSSKEHYVHCNLIEETGKGPRANPSVFASLRNFVGVGTQTADTRCVCGHWEHDELPSSLATVFCSDPVDTEWHVEGQVQVVWPKEAAFLGSVSKWDEVRSHDANSDPLAVKRVNLGSKGWLVGLDETTAAIISGSKVYLIRGGEFRITRRGIIG